MTRPPGMAVAVTVLLVSAVAAPIAAVRVPASRTVVRCEPPAAPTDSLPSATGAPVPAAPDRIAPAPPPSPVARFLADVPLPGPPSRFDYQSLDASNGRLYIAHMGAGRLLVFDTRRQEVQAQLDSFPSVTGVLAVPELGRIYASVAGGHHVAVLDARDLRVIARIPGAKFPDGLDYVPQVGKLFVSDEFGRRELVIDVRTNRATGTVPLKGEAGNTRYDPGSGCVFVAMQTQDRIAAIDPATERVVGQYDLVGARRPHGIYIDAPRRLAFVACEGNARLLVVDLRTMRVISSHPVGDDPDVLAFDPAWRRLFVASEAGTVTVFDETDAGLEMTGAIRAPHAHTVAVDPHTHRIYLPLQDVQGHPVLRILEGLSESMS